jgi:MFS-type transporter involved in bile tolerance (Atg22 family)
MTVFWVGVLVVLQEGQVALVVVAAVWLLLILPRLAVVEVVDATSRRSSYAGGLCS